MFVTGVTERVELDGGEWIEIRKLSAKQLSNAGRAREREVGELLRTFGGDVMASVQRARQDAAAAAAVAAADDDPLTSYERWSVLRDGIVAWSSDRKVTASAIDDLDEATSVTVARAILTLSLPPRDEAARGNA